MNLPSVNATELRSCAEAVEIDASANGEVLSLVHLKGWIFSSHSDGHIKVTSFTVALSTKQFDGLDWSYWAFLVIMLATGREYETRNYSFE
ncbi:putative E3 ubiquitin-protein ligase LIN-1 isoform X2 [Magnolia sinica]|uniref:putative E3 ubiquitin-protein ligase LIN-1 isoform X2 n=1 Tax=Magnolia sinica TaxID=86752 RepID=UPI00265AD340|nr:putative E3 ubiquitin-protein ligase LIN-1 isoform X2 [Magnolia sinica]